MNKGQSLFEVVVAIAISALIITAIVALVTNSIRNSTYSKNESLATDSAQQLLEWLRGQRDLDVTTFLSKIDSSVSGGSSTYCFINLDWSKPTFGTKPICKTGTDEIPGTIFLREATFSQVPLSQTNNKTVFNAEVVVSWTDSQGDHKVVDSTNYSDWRQR